MGEATALRGAKCCIYVLLKLEQACTNSRDLVYASKKIEQACTNSRNLVYVSRKIEQACSILKAPLNGYSELM